MENEEIIGTLSMLLVASRWAELVFSRCSEQPGEPRLQGFFVRVAAQSADAAADLQRMVVQSGGHAPGQEPLAGARAPLTEPGAATASFHGPMAAFEACECVEKESLELYRQALDEPLPALLRLQIERQYQTVIDNHHELRRLRDQTPRDCRV